MHGARHLAYCIDYTILVHFDRNVLPCRHVFGCFQSLISLWHPSTVLRIWLPLNLCLVGYPAYPPALPLNRDVSLALRPYIWSSPTALFHSGLCLVIPVGWVLLSSILSTRVPSIPFFLSWWCHWCAVVESFLYNWFVAFHWSINYPFSLLDIVHPYVNTRITHASSVSNIPIVFISFKLWLLEIFCRVLMVDPRPRQ